jgi:aldose 1-epimerase
MYFPPPPVVFVARRPVGEAPGGRKVDELQLQAGYFMAKIYTYGASLAEFYVPDQWGSPIDVLLGLSGPQAYFGDHAYLGSTVGRVAGRIAGATFDIDGETYTLPKNDDNNSIHGGTTGWDKAVWDVASLDSDACTVTLAHKSSDGDQGYPGEVEATITFSLNHMGVLRIDYGAQVSAKATPVNMTHQLFWNLAGQSSGTQGVLQHAICIAADSYTPVNDNLIPTGEKKAVDGAACDLRETKTLQDAMDAHGMDVNSGGGFDHHLVLNQVRAVGMEDAELHFAGSLQDVSGRYMEVHTSAPGLHLLNKVSDAPISGKENTSYENIAGICLRAQAYPDAVNQSEFPSTVVEAGGSYSQTVEYRFFC